MRRFKQGEEAIEKGLDLHNLLKVQMDVSILKRLLLTPHQLLMFNRQTSRAIRTKDKQDEDEASDSVSDDAKRLKTLNYVTADFT